MRSFNYIRTRFACGDDFVSDAPDAIARDVEVLLAELPALERGLEIGAMALPDQLGSLLHLRARGHGGRACFVHAVVLAGRQTAQQTEELKRLFSSRYGSEPAARIHALCEEFRKLDLHSAVGRVSALFLDPESLESSAGPERSRSTRLWRRRRPTLLRRLRTAAEKNWHRAGWLRPRLARLGERLGRFSSRLPTRLSPAPTAWLWLAATVAWVSSAFLVGYGIGRPDLPLRAAAESGAAARVEAAVSPTPVAAQAPAVSSGPLRPVATTLREARPAEIPAVSCGPPPASAVPADRTPGQELTRDLLAAIARLEALESRLPASKSDSQGTRVARAASAAPLAPIEVATSQRTSPLPPPLAAPVGRPRGAGSASLAGRYASVVADFLLVRAGPGTGFPRLARLPEGTAVRASRTDRDGWTRIGEPVSGWVASRYLSAWSPEED